MKKSGLILPGLAAWSRSMIHALTESRAHVRAQCCYAIAKYHSVPQKTWTGSTSPVSLIDSGRRIQQLHCVPRRLSSFTVLFKEIFAISVEFGKFPRVSCSSAGRPRQVAANRARAGEQFLMAHFPASLSMSRLAGSSGTHKVCESTKSRNRTGGRRWSKSRAPHPPAHAATHFTISLGSRRPQSHDDQVQTLRTVADAQSNDPVRSQASSENESV